MVEAILLNGHKDRVRVTDDLITSPEGDIGKAEQDGSFAVFEAFGREPGLVDVELLGVSSDFANGVAGDDVRRLQKSRMRSEEAECTFGQKDGLWKNISRGHDQTQVGLRYFFHKNRIHKQQAACVHNFKPAPSGFLGRKDQGVLIGQVGSRWILGTDDLQSGFGRELNRLTVGNPPVTHVDVLTPWFGKGSGLDINNQGFFFGGTFDG